jgi:putative phosphoesterase
MLVALLADVHADLSALREALTHIDRLGCDHILCAGDLVGYGDQPEETLVLLQERQVISIAGNHDRWSVADAKLSLAALSFLGSLPPVWKTVIEGVRVVVCHGTPGSDMDPVFASDVNAAVVRSLLDGAEADVLVLGHSHVPMWLGLTGRGIVVNPGALGRMPLGGGWLYNPESGSFGPLEAERGTFGILELPALEFKVMRGSDGAGVEIARRRL